MHTSRLPATSSQGSRRWQSRGTDPKIWGGFCGTGTSLIDFALTFGGADLAPGFALLSTMTFWWTKELW